MLIKLTLTPARNEIWIRAKDIMRVQKNPDNLLETVVMTSLMTPQGPSIIVVFETCEEVGMMANRALARGMESLQ